MRVIGVEENGDILIGRVGGKISDDRFDTCAEALVHLAVDKCHSHILCSVGKYARRFVLAAVVIGEHGGRFGKRRHDGYAERMQKLGQVVADFVIWAQKQR